MIDILCLLFLILGVKEDIKSKNIPDFVSLGIIILGIIRLIIFKEDIEVKILGMGVYPLLFLLIYGYGDTLFKREIIGYGDIKLLASLGFYLNYQGIVRFLVFNNIIFILGGFYGVLAWLYLKEGREDEVPFSPVILIGSLIYYFTI